MKTKWMPMLLLSSLLLTAAAGCRTATTAPDDPPPVTVEKIIGWGPDNFYQIDATLYRSAQPDRADFRALAAHGIRSVLNLRYHHTDDDEAAGSGLTLYALPTNAGDLTEADLLAAVRIIRTAPPPILVHCWHGSDRTGAVVAAYRIAVQGWEPEQALRELTDGGFGYHTIYGNIPVLLRAIDWPRFQAEVNAPAPAAP